jgi:hypothetical protein
MSLVSVFLEEEEDGCGDIFDDNFSKNLQELATESMQKFFDGKEFHCGGKINPNVFKSERCIDRVLNTSIEDGIPLAYKIIEKESLLGDIQIVIGCLSRCGQLGIPKCFRAGILLVNLELCYGAVI